MIGALRFMTSGLGHADGMNFAAAILKSIDGWDRPWINDRLIPGRPWSWRPQWELIDGLLSTCPTSREAFKKRLRPEGAQPQDMAKVQALEQKRWAPWAAKYYGMGKDRDKATDSDDSDEPSLEDTQPGLKHYGVKVLRMTGDRKEKRRGQKLRDIRAAGIAHARRFKPKRSQQVLVTEPDKPLAI